MVKDAQKSKDETHCHHIGYSFRLQQGFFKMHHGFCYTAMEHWLEQKSGKLTLFKIFFISSVIFSHECNLFIF